MTQVDYFKRQPATSDVYYNSIESQVYDDLLLLFKEKLGGGDGKSLADRLGDDNVAAIHAAIVNYAVAPLISGLAAQFHAVQTLKSTTVPVLERDRILHTMPDIFQLHSQITSMGINADVYGTAVSSATAAYKNDDGTYKDGWNPNLIELERQLIDRDIANDITYREGETPLRDEPISIVDIQGRVRERVRYTNFAYVDQARKEQVVTDLPAMWDDVAGEYIFLSMVALWRSRTPDMSILDDTVITGNQVSDGFDPLIDIPNTADSVLGKAIYQAQSASSSNSSTVDNTTADSVVETVTEAPAHSDSGSSSSDSSSDSSSSGD